MPNNYCPTCNGTGYYGECPTREGTGTIPKASRGFWGASLRSTSHAWRLSDDGHEYISLCGDLAIKTIYAPGDARKCALCEEEINDIDDAGNYVVDMQTQNRLHTANAASLRAAVAEVERLRARHDEEADDNATHLREAEGERDAALKRAEEAQGMCDVLLQHWVDSERELVDARLRER